MSDIKYKLCTQCRRQRRRKKVPLFVCQRCGAMCCEHFCGLKNGQTTCGACYLKS